MPAKVTSNTDTIYLPPSFRAELHGPGQCAAYQPARSRRWSSKRFGIISNRQSPLTTAVSSLLTSRTLRSRWTNWSFILPSHRVLLRSLGGRHRQGGVGKFFCPRGSAPNRLARYVRRRGRDWSPRLPVIADPTASADSISKREKCSTRNINMTISLAFLAPDLVKAAIDGRLPCGMGVARLSDLPAEWSRQHQMLGLPAR